MYRAIRKISKCAKNTLDKVSFSYHVKNSLKGCSNAREGTMPIKLEKVSNKETHDLFINLPYEMHKNHSLWVPPLKIFEKNYLDPKKNHHIDHSKIVCYLAYKEGNPAGRIMGIINSKLNETWAQKQARFCNFESINDNDVAASLFNAVETWARENGMEEMVGPLGFSNQDPQGFLIEGFGERPSIGTIYNFEYIPDLVDKCGYEKEVDYVTYKVVIPEKVPEVYEKIAERLLKRATVRVLEFTKKKDAKRYIPKILAFMNEAYSGIYGFIPLSEEVIRKTSNTYNQILDPHFLKVIVNEKDEIVGFIFGIKDVTEGFKKTGGRLIPFGYFQIVCTQKKSKRLDLLLGGIREDFRGKGLDTLMAIAMIRSARDRDMEYVDSHHELESNIKMRAEMERMGGKVYKRHRVYRKDL